MWRRHDIFKSHTCLYANIHICVCVRIYTCVSVCVYLYQSIYQIAQRRMPVPASSSPTRHRERERERERASLADNAYLIIPSLQCYDPTLTRERERETLLGSRHEPPQQPDSQTHAHSLARKALLFSYWLLVFAMSPIRVSVCVCIHIPRERERSQN